MVDIMNYMLIKRTPDGNGRMHRIDKLAISNSKDDLKTFSFTEYGVYPMPEWHSGSPAGSEFHSSYHIGDTFWEGWTEIRNSDIEII